MDFNITLSAANLNDETIQHLAREICTTINQESYLEASINERKGIIGTKGDPVTVGSIALSLLGAGGGAAALMNVFKSYLERSRELCIKVKRPGGEELEITSKNINSDEIRSTLSEFLQRG